MTAPGGPVPLAELVPETVAGMAARAGRADYPRWAAQVAGCGYCARPVRLVGRTETRDAHGRLLSAYSTAGEPDGVAYVRCGNRRAAVCPSCSHEYKGDMWHLLYAGAAGGTKGVPETVAEHPMVFATLTAPGFGPVHTTRADPARGRGSRCRPRRGAPRCSHGRAAFCDRVHREDDPALGEPLCPDCYDYAGHVAFNYLAPELWRRFTIALGRRLAARLGRSPSALREVVCGQYAKVAEFQRRGVVHFHALLRLDGPAAADDPYPPPAVALDAAELAAAVLDAAAGVRLTAPPYQRDVEPLLLRFGAQADARVVHGNREASRGDMPPQMVAAYIAKYATKAAEDFGVTGRLPCAEAVEGLAVPAHVKAIVRTAAKLAATAARTAEEATDPNNRDAAAGWVPLARWLHMLGFRGHFASKSRRFSTTLGRLRTARVEHRRAATRTDGAGPREVGDDHDPVDDETTLVVGSWRFAGMGWLTPPTPPSPHPPQPAHASTGRTPATQPPPDA